jgi:uncharacterized membrane protein
MGRHPGWVRKFLSDADLDAIVVAIAQAEAATSGEIRVHLDVWCPGEPRARAALVFEQLGMTRTAERSGALVYVSLEDRKLAVIGDRGLNERVGQGYWDALVARMSGELREGRLPAGVVAAVQELGAILRAHFPRRPDDRNELGDQVSLGPEG